MFCKLEPRTSKDLNNEEFFSISVFFMKNHHKKTPYFKKLISFLLSHLIFLTVSSHGSYLTHKMRTYNILTKIISILEVT